MDKVPLVIAIPWHRSSSSQTNSFRELSLGLSHRVWCGKNNYCQSTWYKLQWWHAFCTMTYMTLYHFRHNLGVCAFYCWSKFLLVWHHEFICHVVVFKTLAPQLHLEPKNHQPFTTSSRKTWAPMLLFWVRRKDLTDNWEDEDDEVKHPPSST